MEQPEVIPGAEALTGNEKMVAMFSHLSIFFGGLIIPPILWLIYHDRSKYIVFHSVQALVFHFIFTFCVCIIGLILAVIYYSTGMLDKHPSHRPAIWMLLLMLSFCLLSLLFILVGYIYGVYLGINAYKGRMSKYPIIGNIIYKRVYLS